MGHLLGDLESRRQASRAMGGEERLRKHREAGKLDARARIGHLLDPGSFQELATLVGGEEAPAENLRKKIVINRVARQVAPPRLLMDNKLRKQLADDGVDLAQFTDAVLELLMTPAELITQIIAAWDEAEADVAGHTGAALQDIAPGEEILDALFLQYVGRHFDKRTDGAAIAAAMEPPAELAELIKAFRAP